MANTGILKKNNIFTVLQAIKINGPMTKPEIIQTTGLTNASVHNFVNELVERNIIHIEGYNASNGGRKALLYRFNASICYIAGVYLALHEISTFIFDLDLNIITSRTSSMDLNSPDVESNINMVVSEIELAITESGVEKSKIAGIGITVPGPVDFVNGIVLNLVNAPNWKNIPLQSIVRNRVNIPVVLDKVNTGIVLYDKWFVNSSSKKNLVHVSITDGMGSGLLINSQPYRGNNNIAGEIGHITVNPMGEICNCGNRGCVEMFSSDSGILRIIKDRLAKGEKSVLNEWISDVEKISMPTVVKACLSNDSLVKEVFLSAVNYLAIALNSMLKMFGPDEVLIDCYWLEEMPDMFSLLVNTLFQDNRLIDRSKFILQMYNSEFLLIKGSAMLIYDDIFSSFEKCPLI